MIPDEASDRAALVDLIAEYTISNDRAEWDRMERIWAEDAVMLVPGVGTGRYEGKDVIMSRWRSMAAREIQAASAEADGKPPMTFSRHHLTSTRLTFSDTTHAQGSIYYWVATDVGYDHSGTYEDHYVKNDGRWYIAERKILVEHVGPDSYYGMLRTAAAYNAQAAR